MIIDFSSHGFYGFVLLISKASAWWSCLKGWAQDCISNLVDPNCHGSRGSHSASGGWVLSTGPWLISNVSKLPATFAWGEWSLFDEAGESSLKEFQQKNIIRIYIYIFSYIFLVCFSIWYDTVCDSVWTVPISSYIQSLVKIWQTKSKGQSLVSLAVSNDDRGRLGKARGKASADAPCSVARTHSGMMVVGWIKAT